MEKSEKLKVIIKKRGVYNAATREKKKDRQKKMKETKQKKY